jgi:arylsulfatase A
VPLIVQGPGLEGQRIIETPFVNSDWLPTLLELAGASPATRELDGVSQAPLLRTGAPSSSRPFYWHLPHYTNQGSRPAGAMRDGKWKLVEHYDDERVELFDLDADASERRDLSASDPARAAAMRKQLSSWRASVGAQENSPNPTVDQNLYRELYLDFDPTRFDPLRADDAAWTAVGIWRERMNAAVKRPPQ